MSSIRSTVGRAVRLGAVVCVLVAQVVFAQAAPVFPQDPFAALHEKLMGAADRALADTLADRPWMKVATSGKAALSDAKGERQTARERVQRLGTAVQRVQQLRPLVEPILREEGVPAELSAVVLVESGGLTTALSAKGARGVWQFMPNTARRYGLVVSTERDDRLDIAKSTRAAARYLHDLYRQFGDWQLAFAAYNAGEQAVGRAMDRIGQRNFAGIERALPQETRNYVPAVLAAAQRLQDQDSSLPTRVIYASVGPSN